RRRGAPRDRRARPGPARAARAHPRRARDPARRPRAAADQRPGARLPAAPARRARLPLPGRARRARRAGHHLARRGRMTEGEVWEALAGVIDPELGIDIVELGLVYGVEVDAQRVAVEMTLTTPGCPVHDVMVDGVERALSRPG